jgi:cellulose biosynthesis protein BcsQ
MSKLQKVEEDYDVVLIDTPPALNLYARIALISADYLLIKP